jgi:hypothetical protein
MTKTDLLKDRGGRIDLLVSREGAFDSDARIDQAIAESYPASDPPSWSSGVDEDRRPEKPEAE